MKLSENIYSQRRRLSMSQEQLADSLGVSRQAVSKWETGEAVPELDKLTAIAQLFGISIDALVHGEEEKKHEQTENTPAQDIPVFTGSRAGAFSGLKAFLKRRGYIGGYIISGYGAGIALIGGLARLGFGMLISSASDMFSSGLPTGITLFPLIFADVIIGIGAAAVIAGFIIAAKLKKKYGKGGDGNTTQ